VISRAIVAVSPLALLVTSRHVDKHWLQKIELTRRVVSWFSACTATLLLLQEKDE